MRAANLKPQWIRTTLIMAGLATWFGCMAPLVDEPITTTTTSTTVPDPQVPRVPSAWLPSEVVSYAVAPGQFANNPDLTDPAVLLGQPAVGSPTVPAFQNLLSLGGFGGEVVLRFDPPLTAIDGPELIVFGNAFWEGGNPRARFVEPMQVYVAEALTANPVWHRYPGSHDAELQSETITYHRTDTSLPPADKSHYPSSQMSDSYSVTARRAPETICGSVSVAESSDQETVWGYGDVNPVQTPEAVSAWRGVDDNRRVGLDAGSLGGTPIELGDLLDSLDNPVTLNQAAAVRLVSICQAAQGASGDLGSELAGVLRRDLP